MNVMGGASVRSTIGHVAELFGLTHRAIRFYEERGLISPRRDARNRRIFDETARRRLQLITALRRSHLSLPEIEDVLDCPGGETDQLNLALAKLHAQTHRLQLQLSQVKAASEELAASVSRAAA
jgi:DNA-binding transcriptional MerR regulator